MATMTYSTLTQDLKDWMENDGTEFSNETDNFISLAEQRIARDIEPYAFHESATTTFNVAPQTVTTDPGQLKGVDPSLLGSNPLDALKNLQILERRKQ